MPGKTQRTRPGHPTASWRNKPFLICGMHFFSMFSNLWNLDTRPYIYTCIHNIHQNGMIGKQDMKIRGSGLSPFRKKLRNNLNSSVHGNLRGMPAKGTWKKNGVQPITNIQKLRGSPGNLPKPSICGPRKTGRTSSAANSMRPPN